MNKHTLITFLVLSFGFVLQAQPLKPVESASKIGFVIKNFGVGVDGKFSGISGQISFDPNQLSTAKFSVVVQAATINTGISSRDKHLKKEDYFHVEKFSQLRFESVSVVRSTTPGTFILKGNLTIKGVSKAVQIPFTATPVQNGYSFKGSFNINRRDFGVGGSSISLSDELKVDLAVTAVHS